MATVTSIVETMVNLLGAELNEVDQVSANGYLPAINTRSVALIGTALGQQDEGFFYSAGWLHAVHRVPLQFWVKVVQGEEATYIARARDLGYRAMQVLAANDVTGGYTLAATGESFVMSSVVEPQLLDVNGIPYVLVRLTVPVMQKGVV